MRLRLSRSTFPLSLASQNCCRVFGRTEFLHPLCRCQKHPCTNIAAPCRTRTMSGRPGKFRRLSENRKPSRWSTDRTRLSGRVSLPLMRLMFQLRCSAVSLSIRTFLISYYSFKLKTYKQPLSIQQTKFRLSVQTLVEHCR
jgi:hypothetical protein